jgi:phosphonate transport system substrate-binding protein
MCPPAPRRKLASVLLLLCCLFVAGCGTTAPQQEYAPVVGRKPSTGAESAILRLGVRPNGTARHLWQSYEGLLAELNARLSNTKVRLETAQRESAYQAKLRKGEIDVAIVEPQRVIAVESLGYHVFARAGVRDRVSAVVVTRADGPARRLRDLRGRTVWFSAPDSAASAMLVKVMLRYSGVHPAKQLNVLTGDAEDSGLYAVLAGVADAAGVSDRGWRHFAADHPEAAQLLEVRWHTDDLPGPAVMAHESTPRASVAAFKAALLSLRDTQPGRKALAAAGYSEFRHAESGSYDDMWEFLRTYRRVVGPLAGELQGREPDCDRDLPPPFPPPPARRLRHRRTGHPDGRIRV